MLSVTVFEGRNTHNARKHAGEIILVFDAQFCCYLIDPQSCELEILACVLNLQVVEIYHRRVSGFLSENA